MKRILFGIFAVAVAAAQGETDWARLNVAAREHAKTPIRAGVPGVRPFWNAHAKAFIHPPAFEFQEVKGAKAYHFVLFFVLLFYSFLSVNSDMHLKNFLLLREHDCT